MKKKWDLKSIKAEAKKYSTRTDFSKGSGGAYSFTKKNGLLNSVCSHMEHGSIKWTPELLKLEAQKHNTLKDFIANSGGAYKTAKTLGIADEICSHMKRRLPWTFERVFEEAKKYNGRTEFSKGSGGAYCAAKKNCWLNDVCGHMDVLWEKKWDYESVLNEAKKYKYRSDFIHGAPGAYGRARNMDWLSECQTHMEVRPLKWTTKTIADEAKKYEARGEFAKGSGSAYKAASDMGIIDDVCRHMKILYNGYNHCVYAIRNERLKKAYIGVTSQKYELRIIQHCKEDNPCNSKEIINLDDTVCEQLTDYIYSPDDVKSFAEQQFVDQFKADGFHVLNNQKSIGNIGYSRRKWTKELCHTEALKYSTRWDFQKSSVNIYTAAKNNVWLDDICLHMDEQIKSPGYWTKERCINEAKKYKSRNNFRTNATYPYKVMTKNGWTEEVCAHIPVIVYKKWEKPSANLEIWKKAQEFYEAWVEFKYCSGFVLSRHHGLDGHKLNSIVAQFKKGWVPNEDTSWQEWMSTSSGSSL